MKKWTWILCVLPFFAGCVFEPHIPVEMDSISQWQLFKNEKTLKSDIRIDVGILEISGGGGMRSKRRVQHAA